MRNFCPDVHTVYFPYQVNGGECDLAEKENISWQQCVLCDQGH